MKNYENSGDIVTLTAPSGGVVSGKVYKIGLLIVIATATVAEGLPFEGIRQARVTYEKTSAQAWTEGALLYWDDSGKVFTTTSSGNTLCAHAGEVAANPSATGVVLLRN